MQYVLHTILTLYSNDVCHSGSAEICQLSGWPFVTSLSRGIWMRVWGVALPYHSSEIKVISHILIWKKDWKSGERNHIGAIIAERKSINNKRYIVLKGKYSQQYFCNVERAGKARMQVCDSVRQVTKGNVGNAEKTAMTRGLCIGSVWRQNVSFSNEKCHSLLYDHKTHDDHDKKATFLVFTTFFGMYRTICRCLLRRFLVLGAERFSKKEARIICLQEKHKQYV